jgi:hypothetical protein
VTLLLSYSKDTVADVNATSANDSTALMLCLSNSVQMSLQGGRNSYRSKTHAQNCAQLLLDNGASVAPDELTQLCRRADDDTDAGFNERYAAIMHVLSRYMMRLRSAVAAHDSLLTVHSEACSISSVQQYTSTAVHTGSSKSSSGNGSSGTSAAAAYAGASSSSAATGDAQNSSGITVQLVHAVTGVKAAKLYKLELRTLERLLAVHSSDGQTSSVLLNLLRPPTGWRTQQQQQQCDTTELKYAGKC